MKNWLLNPSGLPNRFVEMDLVQEHLNLRVKVQTRILFMIDRLRHLIKFYTGILQGSGFERLMANCTSSNSTGPTSSHTLGDTPSSQASNNRRR
jgi:hypothetical protein